jgi:hypothetical protein
MSETTAGWSATEWEHAWQVVTRRLNGGPADFLTLPEVQTIKAELDQTFLVGDSRRFAESAVQLVELADECAEDWNVAPWWKVTH